MKQVERGERKRAEILTFIEEYLREKGHPPSVREIGAGVGLSSTSTVHSHLRKLAKSGALIGAGAVRGCSAADGHGVGEVMATPARPSQLSMIEGMERPVGPIPPSVCTGSNADLIASVAPMYLTGSVLDVTYGGGKWWDRFTPDPFAFHDLAIDGVDFRALPHADGEFETVCFDPPYVLSGGKSSGNLADQEFQHRYGIGIARNGAKGQQALFDLILDGLAEACRVASAWVLVKCMEFAQGSGFCDVPTLVTNRASELGWFKHDQIVHHTGTGPGGHNIFRIKRCRRAHSYLLVFSRQAI